MAMSFTFSDAEFQIVLSQWTQLKDQLDQQASTYERLGIWVDLPPAADPSSHAFMENARDALQSANGFGQAAREYVTEFHHKLSSARKDYLDADEDGVQRFRITLGEGDQP